MALPEDVSTFTLNFGAYTDAAGAVALVGAKGKLFPVDPVKGKRLNLVHIATGQEIIPNDLTVTIADDGTASVGPIPHTDNPGLSTVGFAYRVEWAIASSKPSPGNLTFAAPAAAGAAVDYDLLTPAEAVPGIAVPVVTGATGPQGPIGETGPTGPTGPSGTITSATASALAPGATPTVTLGGTPSARTMAFGLPGAVANDASVAALIPGPSATATALSAALAPLVVSAAVADGSTDVSAQVQAKLDAARDAGGGVVRLPSGLGGAAYRVKGLVIYSNTVLDARGATVQHAGGDGPILTNAAWRTTARGATDGQTTTGSAVITSATLNFTSADVGKRAVVQNGGGLGIPLITTIASVESATQATLATPVVVGFTPPAGQGINGGPAGDYVAVGPRDSNIHVIGGVWDRRNIQGTDDWRRHSIILYRVDGASVSDVTYQSTAGKYGVYLGDITRATVQRYHLNAYSDGVHISGPSRDVVIRQVTGHSNDDGIAFTCLDGFKVYQDSHGPWNDVHVEDIRSTSNTATLKFRADGVSGVCNGSAVRITGAIVVDGGINTGGIVSALNFRDCRAAWRVGYIYSNLTVGLLSIVGNDIEFNSSNARMIGLRNVTIDELAVSDFRMKHLSVAATGTHCIAFETIATVRNLVVDKGDVRLSTGSSLIAVASSTASVGRVKVSRSYMASETAGQGNIFNQTSANNAAPVAAIHLTDVTAENTSHLVSASNVTGFPLYLNGVQCTSTALSSSSPVIVHGAGINTADNTNVGAGGNVRSKTADFRVDVARLLRVRGDVAHNINSGLACGQGVVISNGTSWKNLYTAAEYT